MIVNYPINDCLDLLHLYLCLLLYSRYYLYLLIFYQSVMCFPPNSLWFIFYSFCTVLWSSISPTHSRGNQLLKSSIYSLVSSNWSANYGCYHPVCELVQHTFHLQNLCERSRYKPSPKLQEEQFPMSRISSCTDPAVASGRVCGFLEHSNHLAWEGDVPSHPFKHSCCSPQSKEFSLVRPLLLGLGNRNAGPKLPFRTQAVRSCPVIPDSP